MVLVLVLTPACIGANDADASAAADDMASDKQQGRDNYVLCWSPIQVKVASGDGSIYRASNDGMGARTRTSDWPIGPSFADFS